ncbi:MAG: adenylate kinase [Gemmatimonadales bacterium]|nr:MAG: adenylate kinase [Gemmatimonadales bacterium]
MMVVLLGPPGVGKGTQGAILADDLGWHRLATGDVLRAARREGTQLGREAQRYMDRGDLVPDEIIVGMVRERLESLGADTGVILDGFPRTVPQAEALEEVLGELGAEVDAVLELTAPDDVLVKRISGRRSCAECGRLYNTYFDPPEVDGQCDDCGTSLTHRDDDDAETVAHRLEVYRAQTEPLVEFYRETDAELIRVDGDRSMPDVQAAIRSALEERLGVAGDEEQ